MSIINHQYLAAAQDLANILQQHRETYHDFLSQVIFQKADVLLTQAIFQVNWNNDPVYATEHAKHAVDLV